MRLQMMFGAVLAALCVLTAPAGAAPGSPGGQSPAAAGPQTARPLTREDLEAWLDGYMPYALQRGDVAGAVVVVVKDGQVLLQKGYGYADVASRRPVDPETTLFRPGSVSKLITWTAVMQQVEQGRIDLDRDVNAYLDFKIPPLRGQPITLRNLMTHTPGFEDTLRDLVTPDARTMKALRPYLTQNRPNRIYRAGEVPAYSNYGVALAGYIVQRTSGVPFDDYVEQHIFQPLGMKNATFRQPLPAALSGQMATTYRQASLPPKPYEMFSAAPAGSAAISGADMAKFMIAHLQDGEYGGRRILQPATAKLMHDSRLTTISPSLNRMALGFWGMDQNGHRILGHEGDTIWFHSMLQLFPDDRVGLFMSQNSLGRDGAARVIRQGLIDGFADRYFPAGPLRSQHVSPEVSKAHAAMLAGQYDGSQWLPNFLSLGNLVGQVTVTADSAGRVAASSARGPNGHKRWFEEISPYVWREVGGQERLAAKVVDGKVAMWSLDSHAPTGAYLPTPGWRDARWLAPALGAALAVLLLSAAMWPIRAFARWRCGAPFPLEGAAAHSYRWAHLAAAAAGLLLLAWLLTVQHVASTFDVASTIDPWILTLHLLSLVVFPGAALVALGNVWVVAATRKGWRNAGAWIWSGLLALSTLTLLWVALVYRLIGLSPHF
ncbi:MAG: serine hydrolase domain-containing protein [Phenylobacterium sp.]